MVIFLKKSNSTENINGRSPQNLKIKSIIAQRYNQLNNPNRHLTCINVEY